jgi:hypothetical protein
VWFVETLVSVFGIGHPGVEIEEPKPFVRKAAPFLRVLAVLLRAVGVLTGS